MEIYLLVGLEGSILACSTHELEPAENQTVAKIDIGENHNLFEDFQDYKYINQELVYNSQKGLERAKNNKMEELQKKCQETIEAGFSYNYNDTEYWFSLDAEAQSNFISAYQIMRDGLITEVPWTVKVNNEYSRLIINVEMMKDISNLILLHKTNNIAKFRDILSPIVESATTIEEVESITW